MSPRNLNLGRGRQSRADLVMALLRGVSFRLADIETGGEVRLTVLDLVEALLRDPFWDDIDASVEEEGIVADVLRGDPSPSVLLSDGRQVSSRLGRAA